MHCRCPHCHNPVEIVDDDELTDISCPSCGSNFHLVSGGDATQTLPYELRTIAHFELLEQAGVGSFGAVWKARDTNLDRIVAVKIPRTEGLTETQQSQFFKEARAAAQIKHPGIVSVHEVGRTEKEIYIVSDYIDGATLSEWTKAKPLSNREAGQLCSTIADALHAAHEAGVVHRDLKPANILMDLDGNPNVADFGLAKRDAGEITMTMDGQILGTPAYMSPEQAKGDGHNADRRSDVYSLGVILYQLLTGELPFRGDTRMLIVQILQDDPTPPRKLSSQVPRDLETICLKCLSKNPERRYQTAKDLSEDLNRWLAGEAILARPVGKFETLWRWSGKNAAPLAGLYTVAESLVLSSSSLLSTASGLIEVSEFSEGSDFVFLPVIFMSLIYFLPTLTLGVFTLRGSSIAIWTAYGWHSAWALWHIILAFYAFAGIVFDNGNGSFFIDLVSRSVSNCIGVMLFARLILSTGQEFNLSTRTSSLSFIIRLNLLILVTLVSPIVLFLVLLTPIVIYFPWGSN